MFFIIVAYVNVNIITSLEAKAVNFKEIVPKHIATFLAI